jgi:beta-lactamase regulating signal transducer with metallopeptidase domain
MEAYLLKSSIALIILYAVYKLLIRYEFNHQFNRITGLACLIFSVSFPFVKVTVNGLDQDSQISDTLSSVVTVSGHLQDNVAAVMSVNVIDILLVIYAIGVGICSLRTLLGLASLFRLTLLSPKYKAWGFTVVALDRKISPFAFFNLLFMGTSQVDGPEMDAMILHEQIHRDQYHSLDSVFLEILTIVFWFNPAVWFFRKDIREQHEFFADEYVLRKGFNVVIYQQILFKVQTGVSVELANHLSIKTSLTKRFKMMTQIRSNSKSGYWKASLFLVMMSVMLVMGSFLQPEVEQVDQQATYEQGEEAMMKKIATEIKYPASARTENRSGLVDVSFTVNEKGDLENVEAKSLSNAYVLKEIVVVSYSKSAEKPKGVDDVLKAESVRVVSGLGKFIPAQKDGKAVRSVLTLPIKFKLD